MSGTSHEIEPGAVFTRGSQRPEPRRTDLMSEVARATAVPVGNRLAVLLYGSSVYALFLGTFVYTIGFVSGIGVPRTIETPGSLSAGAAVVVNLGLLGLFAAQHMVMARQWFKERFTRIIPPAAERSTFVLATCALLVGMFVLWQGIAAPVWSVTHPVARGALFGIAAAGWGTVLLSTFLIDHFDLFGLRQVIRHFRGHAPSSPAFRVRGLYRHVRHPLYLGFLAAFWAAPDMSWGRLLFAVGCTVFILVAVQFEERDLIRAHPRDYAAYRDRVPMLFPIPGRTWR